jgi:Bacterial Ig-like domain
VVPGALPLLGGERKQEQVTQEVARSGPETISRREASSTRFANLTPSQAAREASTAFGGLVDHVGGAGPSLQVGQKIANYLNDHAAEISLPNGKKAVVESAAPMALETSAGHREAVDLGLTKVGSIFESVRPTVGVLIPQQLSAGIQLPESGLSLTPVNPQGQALAGSASPVEDASVIYANTEPDTDTIIKPTPQGVEADAILRSVDSPREINLRVGLPDGASLSQSEGRTGPISIVKEGQVIALVRPPHATDATGTPVPVSMSAAGDVLSLTVSAEAGQYEWPIAVDPELASVEDRKTDPEAGKGNWFLSANQESKFGHYWNLGSGSLEMYNLGSNAVGEYIQVGYHTRGESKIYKVELEPVGKVEHGRAKLQLIHEGGEEKVYEGGSERSSTLAERTYYFRSHYTFCANSACSLSGGSNGNEARYKLETVEEAKEAYNLESDFANAYVWIAQEKAPEVTFNESEPIIDSGRPNVLYGNEHFTGGSEPWLGPNSGAFEVKAHDPGIGVSWAQVGIGSWRQEFPIYKEGKCIGIQCPSSYSVVVTYNPAMPEGEQTLNWYAKDLAGDGERPEGELSGLLSENTQLVKVDAQPPYNIEVSGWPRSREISATAHTLTFEATDGSGSVHSSGVRSISVSVDGGAESSVPNVSCTLGPCTVSGKWTLDAEGLTEGVHRLVVTATDNAGNVAAREFQFDVRHGSPVSVRRRRQMVTQHTRHRRSARCDSFKQRLDYPAAT